MKIEKLTENKIRIILKRDDFKDKKININWAEVMQKYNISENDLILSAKDQQGINFDNL